MSHQTSGRKWRDALLAAALTLIIGLLTGGASGAVAHVLAGPSDRTPGAPAPWVEPAGGDRSSNKPDGPRLAPGLSPTARGRRPNAPLSDAFLALAPGTGGTVPAPPNGGSVLVGSRFVFDLMLNTGSHTDAIAQQSYLTFTSSVLQNARLSDIDTACTPAQTGSSTLPVCPAGGAHMAPGCQGEEERHGRKGDRCHDKDRRQDAKPRWAI